MRIRKRPGKQVREARKALLPRALKIADVISHLEAVQCPNICTEHLIWSCDVEAGPEDESYPMVWKGGLYPDGGWTAEMLGVNDTYRERMAFIPGDRLLIWQFRDDYASLILSDSEAMSLCVGQLPTT